MRKSRKLPARNDVRFNYLIGLARRCEEQAAGCSWSKQEKLLKLAAVYREMALAVMPSGLEAKIVELTTSERAGLAAKLRAMIVENGCTPAESAVALEKLFRLEG